MTPSWCLPNAYFDYLIKKNLIMWGITLEFLRNGSDCRRNCVKNSRFPVSLFVEGVPLLSSELDVTRMESDQKKLIIVELIM